MKTLISRIKSETPKFFKNLIAISLTMGGVATSIIMSNDSLNLGLSADVIQYLKYAVAVSIAVASVSKTTKID